MISRPAAFAMRIIIQVLDRDDRGSSSGKAGRANEDLRSAHDVGVTLRSGLLR